jgi:hypothetical protein
MGTLKNKGQILNWGKIEIFKRFRDQYVKFEKLSNCCANKHKERPIYKLGRIIKINF